MSNPDLEQINEVLPDVAKDDEVKATADDLQIAKAFNQVRSTPQGKVVIDSLLENALDIISVIRGDYLNMSESKLRSLFAAYDENISMIERFMNSGKEEKAIQKELDRLVIEKQYD